MNVFELFAKIGLDTTEYDKGLEGAEKSASSFGSKLKKGVGVAAGVSAAAITATTAAAVAGTKAFISGVSSVAQYGDEIDKTSQRLGISAEKYQQFDYVLNIAGTSMQNMQMGMKTLTNQLDNAKNGSTDAAAKFEALGISMDDINNLSREEIFEKAIYGFQGMADSTERAALANDLFGRSGQELTPLFNMTQEQTQELIETADKYGMVMSSDAVAASATFQDSLTTLQGTMSGVKNNLLSEFLPSMSTVMDGLAAVFSGDSEKGLGMIETGIKDLANNLIEVAPRVMQIGGAILNALVSSITTNLPILIQTAVPIVLEIARSLISAAPNIISGVISLIGTIGSELANPENLNSVIESAVAIIMTISNAISENAETVIPAVVEIIMQMLAALTDSSVLMPLLSAGLSVITSVVQGILKAIPVLIKNLPTIISNITDFLIKSTPMIIQAAIQLLMGIIQAIPQIIVELGRQMPTIISSIVKGLTNGLSSVKNVGGQLISGLWNGINDKVGWITSKIQSFGKSVTNSIKKIFGIASPSKVFRDEVGQFLAIGLGEGFEGAMPKTIAGMTDSAEKATAAVADSMSFDDMNMSLAAATTGSVISASNSAAAIKNGSNLDMGPFTFNIYASEGQDIRELAKEVTKEIQNLINDKEKAYGLA